MAATFNVRKYSYLNSESPEWQHFHTRNDIMLSLTKLNNEDVLLKLIWIKHNTVLEELLISPRNQTVSVFARYPSIGFKSHDKRFQITIDMMTEFDSIIDAFATYAVYVKLQQATHSQATPNASQQFYQQTQHSGSQQQGSLVVASQVNQFQDFPITQPTVYATPVSTFNLTRFKPSFGCNNSNDHGPLFRAATRTFSRASTPSLSEYSNNDTSGTSYSLGNRSRSTINAPITPTSFMVDRPFTPSYKELSSSFIQNSRETTSPFQSNSREPSPSVSRSGNGGMSFLSQIVKRPVTSTPIKAKEKNLREYTEEEIMMLLKDKLNDEEFIEFVTKVESSIDALNRGTHA